MDYSNYSELDGTGFENRKPTDPKDEFFHSVYIAGITRTNQDSISEEAGKLQVRGVEYNQHEIFMIITHTKEVLVKTKRDATGKEKLECFSFKDPGVQWKGTYKNHVCGTNSAERATDPWCNQCRTQIIVVGILCDINGTPKKKEDGKSTFVFIRGKGMKYSPISEYLNDMARMDLPPIVKIPDNIIDLLERKNLEERARRFEKSVVNSKRFVTKVTISEVPSNFGPKKVYILSAGTKIADGSVEQILEISKKILDKFREKFNWARLPATTGYIQDGGDELMPVDDPSPTTTTEPPKQTQPQQTTTQSAAQKTFSFEDLDF